LDRLYYETGIGTIVIGIEYDNNHPWDEYMPWDNLNMYKWVRNADVVYGVGDKFLEFIVDDLKPHIDETYHTKTDAAHTAIGGGSRSGLFSLYASLVAPDVFSKAMAMSPAVWMAEGGPRSAIGQPPYWFQNNGLGRWLDNHQPPTTVKYYIHIGTNETYGMPGAPYPEAYLNATTKVGWKYVYENGADRTVSKLLAKVPNSIVRYHKTNEDHMPSVWGKYVEDALIWFGFYH
jgi:S-formylglutathione hydrolase FrmB